MNRAFSCFILLFFSITVFAQTTYTLQQCIDSAFANNIPVKQADLLKQTAAVNWRQARMNLLPIVNASASHGVNSGRSIDPFTNTYVNQSVNRASYGINSGVTLFNGLTLQNRIKENAYIYEATKMELQQSKDQLALDVILAYLQVLNNEDQVQVNIIQAERSQKTLDRLQVMNNQGAVKPSDVTDMKGELMENQLAILNSRNQLETSKLNLTQLMNKPYDPNIKLERINVEEFLANYTASANDVYENSLKQFAQVKAVELRTKSSQYSVKAAKGQLFPELSFGANINTNYSSIAQIGGQKIPYTDQLKNNRFTAVGFGLNIPIFNSFFARNRIKLADIALRNDELIEENTKLQLHQDIDQAYLNMVNSFERYKLLLQQVSAYEESFKAAEVRFNAGVGTSIDYLLAKDRFDNANTNLLNARYDFVLRKRILDYYYGKR